MPLMVGAPIVAVDVTVIEPDTLGPPPSSASDPRYLIDEHIVRWANITGYPPQLLKAHADWESVRRFNPRQYRYEPLTTDWDNFAGSPGKLADPKYAAYRLATCAAQGAASDGERLKAEDLTFRSRYEIDADHQSCPPAATTSPASFRAIAAGDEQVTAYEIYIGNDTRRRENWFRMLGKKWKRDAIEEDASRALGFTAQTTMASSYGVMQVLWTTAVENDEYNFRVGVEDRNPSFLTDESANLDAGCSSLVVGAMFMKRKAQQRFRREPPDLTSEATFMESFRVPLRQYNGRYDYPDDVFRLVSHWYPTSTKPIFK
ncbi:MAG TPA: hypothetical protein VFN10_04460 [Thermoanaerobaculia bacterium]|nr:hypothetical protein [Thermoanaerobaculia bacterium]